MLNGGRCHGWLHHDFVWIELFVGRWLSAQIYVSVKIVFVRQCVDAVKEENETSPRCRAKSVAMLMFTVSSSRLMAVWSLPSG